MRHSKTSFEATDTMLVIICKLKDFNLNCYVMKTQSNLRNEKRKSFWVFLVYHALNTYENN